jgi:hypothetical protein
MLTTDLKTICRYNFPTNIFICSGYLRYGSKMEGKTSKNICVYEASRFNGQFSCFVAERPEFQCGL